MKKNLFLVFSLLFLSTNFAFAQNFSNSSLQKFFTNFFSNIAPLQIPLINSYFQSTIPQNNTPTQQVFQPASLNNSQPPVPQYPSSGFAKYIQDISNQQPTQSAPTQSPASQNTTIDPVTNFKNNPDMIKAVQSYLGVNADGVLGPQTMSAINKFRADQNNSADNGDKLPISKSIDDKTLQRLDDQMSQPQQSQQSSNDLQQTGDSNLAGGCGGMGGCVGMGMSLFGTERDGDIENEAKKMGSKMDDGNTYCDKTRTVYYKNGKVDKDRNKKICVAAMTDRDIKKLCGGGRCFCGKTVAKITLNGKSITVPVEDRGDAKTFDKNHVILDATGACFEKLDPNGSERTFTKATIQIVYNGKTQTASK